MPSPYNVKSKVLGAFRHLLVPLVRILIRNGIGFHEFAQVSKEVYARVCIREFAATSSDERISNSRIAIVTGLTRREVAALLGEDGPMRRGADSDAGIVANLLQGWHTDPDFVGPYGVPRDLYLDSDPLGLQTFSELVRRYGGGATRGAILDELRKIDAAVIPTAGEPIRVLKRTYIPESAAPDALEVGAKGLRRLSETVDHNLQNGDSGEKLFERWVFPDDGILERDWDRFHALVSERLQELVRELDAKFSWFESPRTKGEDGISVGVGLIVYRDSADDERDWQQLLEAESREH